MKKNIYVLFGVLLILLINTANAVYIKDTEVPVFSPGNTDTVKIYLKNDLDTDLDYVSFTLDFSNSPFNVIGSSEFSINNFDEGDTETLQFKIRADSKASSGDYAVPFTLTYTDEEKVTKEGTIGFRIVSFPEISFIADAENPVLNTKGKITLKIINSGMGDARFSSIKIVPGGYTLLSEDSAYIGEVSADDFETASFDVIYNSKNLHFTGFFDYTDIENKKTTIPFDIPLNIYNNEEAIARGIIKKSNTSFYISLIIGLFIIWYLYRIIKRKMRRKRNISEKI